MTTDTVPKQVALHHDDNWTVGGMAKGAGMLAPSLATMLCVITTDAVADADALDRALRNAAARTFDRLDVDGSCSTNDTVLLLASGASEITPSQDELDAAVLRGLRRPVRAAAGRRRRRHQARRRHRHRRRQRGRRASSPPGSIARDSLVKTALFGSDPNWGRVLAAVGMAPVDTGRRPDQRVVQRFSGVRRRRRRAGRPRGRPVRCRHRRHRRPRRRRRRRRPSAPPTCPTPTSKRTRRTAHDVRRHRRPRRRCSPRRCRGSSSCTARSSSSSTAATP